MKKLTTNEFIEKCKLVHGDLYDYSKVEYTISRAKVEITCNEHGSFTQTANRHLNGQGCPKCANKKRGIERHTTEQFVQKAKRLHGDLYDYSKVEYNGSTVKVEIICPIHGSFFQTPNRHLAGQCCAKCYHDSLTDDTGTFISKAKSVHGTKYDYSLVKYEGSYKKVKLICPKHGTFLQTPSNHLLGSICPQCSGKRASRASQEWLDYLNIDSKYREYTIWLKDGSRIHADGFDPSTNTIYEFWGDYWHGNPEMYDLDDYNVMAKKTYRELYTKTLNKISAIQESGYVLVDIWESDWYELKNHLK